MERDKLFLKQYEQVWLQRRQHVGHIWAIPTIVTALVGIFVTLLINHEIHLNPYAYWGIAFLFLVGLGFFGLFWRHNFFIKALGLLLQDLAAEPQARYDLPQFGKEFKDLYWDDLDLFERFGSLITATWWWALTSFGIFLFIVLNWLPLFISLLTNNIPTLVTTSPVEGNFPFPLPSANDLPNILWGGILGFVLVFLVEWLRTPVVRFKGFQKDEFSDKGILYKAKFLITGKFFFPFFALPIGISVLEILYRNHVQFAKWDETPEPVSQGQFHPEAVPGTFYQTLFLKKTYCVPVLHQDKDKKLTIFCGWWYGRAVGYGENLNIEAHENITLNLKTATSSWARKFKVSNVIK